MKTKTILKLSGLFLLSACANMPTKPAQITSAYVSPIKYEKYTCTQLTTEMNNLARRENQLVLAQEQRIKSSDLQALWLGYAQGDGLEAAELANVRGEKEAVLSTLNKKQCKY